LGSVPLCALGKTPKTGREARRRGRDSALLYLSPSQAAAPASHPPTPDDICRALEQDAAENELPVEFFARVIWQENRFNVRKGAQGIAQFRRTCIWRGGWSGRGRCRRHGTLRAGSFTFDPQSKRPCNVSNVDRR
jgi:hypothetical protein